eukprot:CAMPEP_0180556766 /NCGR_PEP_ID=MMETSP1037_2-20121125/782_1 /TAXON_ID=632150 /ORGANISM="Azadinium spinosum, Strain 3D9" /LENGTH=124 /DNA_ID=CAMNT_0022572881 /DNA_START=1068 /DNA_END=1443 /DNA_ORIENTATION=+
MVACGDPGRVVVCWIEDQYVAGTSRAEIHETVRSRHDSGPLRHAFCASINESDSASHGIEYQNVVGIPWSEVHSAVRAQRNIRPIAFTVAVLAMVGTAIAIATLVTLLVVGSMMRMFEEWHGLK